MSVSDISGQALGSNDSHIVSQASSVNSVTNPIFYVLGFLVLALGAVIAIDAFR